VHTTAAATKPTSNNDAAGYDDAIRATHDASDANDADAATNRTDTRCSAPTAATHTTTTAHVPRTIAAAASSSSSSATADSHLWGPGRFSSCDSRNDSVATAASAAGPTAAT